MAKAASKASAKTTLVLGKLEIPISLFSTQDKPEKLAEFTTAGPNGGRLMVRPVAAPVPVAEDAQVPVDVPVHSTCHSDPLSDGPSVTTVALSPPSTTIAGEYQRELVEDGTGQVVEPDQVRRGVRLEDDRFIDCTEQLAEIERQTRIERAEIVAFVNVGTVPRARVKAAQYVGTDDPNAPRALRLLYEAMRQRRRVAVLKLTKRSRQTLGVLGWLGDALMFYELVWSEDFRPPPARATVIQKATVTAAEVEQAVALVDAMSGTGDVVDEMRDDAIALREQLMAQALEGLIPNVVTPRYRTEPVMDLSAQLEASLAAMNG
jgi:DNA end-binding protein Ku